MINNVINNLKKHYLKIGKYKRHLQEKGIIKSMSNIKVGFFIEDKTILGCYYRDNFPNGLKPLNIVNCKEFLDYFENCKDLDFCLCSNQDFRRKDKYLYILSNASIEKFRQSEIKNIDEKFMTFNQNIYGLNKLL